MGVAFEGGFRLQIAFIKLFNTQFAEQGLHNHEDGAGLLIHVQY
jgi:hypothetical protein